jgi:hypothetical protein
MAELQPGNLVQWLRRETQRQWRLVEASCFPGCDLETEPWLFAINRRGVIVARLEGSFGINELRRALRSALS